MSKRAVILAGGKGTRMKPYTIGLPKPLVPIGGMPILEIIIKQLVKHGFTKITITVNHMAELIEDFFGDGSDWNVKIDYSLEDKPLSTMGPLTLIKDLPDHFLVMNGDVLTDLDYGRFYNTHVKGKRLFTISSFKRTQKVDYGVLNTNGGKSLVGFQEKPEIPLEVSMGIYMASKHILKYIPNDTCFGFDHLMLELIRNQVNPAVECHNSYWVDIGSPEDYEKARKDIQHFII